MAKYRSCDRTDRPELRLAKKRAEQIFRSGNTEHIEAISHLLEMLGNPAARWAREQKQKRAKLIVIRGGRTGDEHPGTS